MPAQATNSRFGSASNDSPVNGTRSVAVAGTSSGVTVAPSAPNTAEAAATLACPKAVSCAKIVTVLPCRSPMNDAAVWMCPGRSGADRKVYLLTPVMPSVAAGPEMNSTWFSAASGAICRATPDEADPARTL